MTAGVRETPTRFGREAHLVGIASRPTVNRPLPVVVFLNSGIVHSIGANRIYVRLARALATEGFPTFRFDLSGLGDSDSAPEGADLERTEVVAGDVRDAFEEARRQTGAQQAVLIGLCSGADDALGNVLQDDAIVGAIAIDPDIIRTPRFFLQEISNSLRAPHAARRAVRRAFKATPRLNTAGTVTGPGGTASLRASKTLSHAEMRDRLRAHVRKGKKELFLFTAGLPQRYNYHDQFKDAFRGIDYDDLIEFAYFRNADHTFSTEAMRVALVEHIVAWCQRSFPDHEALASMERTG